MKSGHNSATEKPGIFSSQIFSRALVGANAVFIAFFILLMVFFLSFPMRYVYTQSSDRVLSEVAESLSINLGYAAYAPKIFLRPSG